MHKRKIASAVSFLLIPAVILLGYFFLEREHLYLTCAAVLILSMIPFFLSLESKKLHARELTTLASMTAIAVASRAAFYALPQIKPMCAIIIITAVVFGSQIGFLTGALSMLLSNFIFGQGMWTPFQMFAMGLCGLLAGIIFHNKKSSSKPILVAIAGATLCFFVYGIIADLNSVLMFSSHFSIPVIISVYTSGLPFNLIHSATTFAVLILFSDVFIKVLKRIKIKYGLFDH